MKKPDTWPGSLYMGQIPLAPCIVRGRCDEGVTGQIRKARRWAGLVSVENWRFYACKLRHEIKVRFFFLLRCDIKY